jgi:hypothetical protein
MSRVAFIAALALSGLGAAAVPAFAQGTFSPGGSQSGGYGTFAPGVAKPKSSPAQGFGLPRPGQSATATKPKTYAPSSPASPAFKPHEPWRPNSTTSLFGPDGKPKKKTW